MTVDTVLARVTTSPSAAPVEVVTPIKPSEAIRLGCLTKPLQLFGATYSHDGRAACAVGAMAVGFGDKYDLPFDDLSALPCPFGCQKPDESSWGGGVGPLTPAHLNDDHRWSRERIADWLEGLGL